MRKFVSLSPVFFVIILFVFPAFCQDKDKLAPMPSNASLEEDKAWFVKELGKNFGYTSIDDSVKISGLKFDGCHLSYRVVQRYTDQKSDLGDRPALGQTGATGAVEISYNVYEDISFDLNDMDPAAVALGPLATPKSMQVISIQTREKKDKIKFDRKGSRVQYNASGLRSTTLFPIKESAAESLGKGLQKLIQVCQTAPIKQP